MGNIFLFLTRLFSWRNLLAVATASVIVVWIPRLLIQFIYGVIQLCVNAYNDRSVDVIWLISPSWLSWFTGILFVILVSVPVLCQLKISFDIRNKYFEKVLDVLLTVLMWPTFAVMLLFFFNAIAIMRFLERRKEKWPWAIEVIHIIIGLLARTAVFQWGLVVKVSGSFPKRRSVWSNLWLKVQGKEVPKENGYIVTPGHEASFDYGLWSAVMPLAVYKVIAGTNLLKFPVFSALLKIKCILVDRDSEASRKETGEQARGWIREGNVLVVAPEGGRKRKEEPGVLRDISKWEDGAFVLACRTGVDIVPMNVIGSGHVKPPIKGVLDRSEWWKLWKYQWYNRYDQPIYIDILPPISTAGKRPQEVKEEVFRMMDQEKRKRLGLALVQPQEETEAQT